MAKNNSLLALLFAALFLSFCSNTFGQNEVCSTDLHVDEDTCLTNLLISDTTSVEFESECIQDSVRMRWIRINSQQFTSEVKVKIINHDFSGDVLFKLVKIDSCDQIVPEILSLQCGDPDFSYRFLSVNDSNEYYLGIGSSISETPVFDMCFEFEYYCPNCPPGIGNVDAKERDCQTAYNLTTSTFYQYEFEDGPGDLIESGGSCVSGCAGSEIWVIFTTENAGPLGFTIESSDNKDFALFDITDQGCNGIEERSPIRCNVCTEEGYTGVDVSNSSAELQVTEGYQSGCNNIIQGLLAEKGQTFALLISDYGYYASGGYRIKFEGVEIADSVPPGILGASFSCDYSYLDLTLSVPVACDSFLLSDFELIDAVSGTDNSSFLNSISGYNCDESNFTTILRFSMNSSLPSGEYSIRIKSGISNSNIKSGKASLVAGQGTDFFWQIYSGANDTVFACDSFEWYGNYYFESGTYYSYYYQECGIFDTLNLVIEETDTSSIFKLVGCDSIMYGDQYYLEDTVIFDTTFYACGTFSVKTVDINVLETNSGYIAGRIETYNGSNYANCLVELLDWHNLEVVESQRTNLYGEYNFSGFERGQYSIRAVPDSPSPYGSGFIITYYGQDGVSEFSSDFVGRLKLLRCNDSLYLDDLQVLREDPERGPGVVSGVVINVNGNDSTAIAGEQIMLLNTSGNKIQRITTTDDNGEFVIENVAFSKYYVALNIPGYTINEDDLIRLHTYASEWSIIVCADTLSKEIELCSVRITDPSDTVRIDTLGTINDLNRFIDLFPNPSNGTFWIRTSKSMIQEVKILDLSGRLIFVSEPNLSSGKYQVSELKLDNGNYLVEAKLLSGEVVRKRVVVFRN